ncbi:MAG: hypothetical protein MUF13_04480 [Akkermansiaceae bacterium]|nr:hypothetical protein [Akkermansiaceae bacterium]
MCQSTAFSNFIAFLPKAIFPSSTTIHSPKNPIAHPIVPCLMPSSQSPPAPAITGSVGHTAQAPSPMTEPAQVMLSGMIRCSASMKVIDTSKAISTHRKITTCGGKNIHVATNKMAVRSSTPK